VDVCDRRLCFCRHGPAAAGVLSPDCSCRLSIRLFFADAAPAKMLSRRSDFGPSAGELHPAETLASTFNKVTTQNKTDTMTSPQA